MTLHDPVTTTDAKLLVAGMSAGTYTFEVVARDNSGIDSDPSECKVQVTAQKTVGIGDVRVND